VEEPEAVALVAELVSLELPKSTILIAAVSLLQQRPRQCNILQQHSQLDNPKLPVSLSSLSSLLDSLNSRNLLSHITIPNLIHLMWLPALDKTRGMAMAMEMEMVTPGHQLRFRRTRPLLSRDMDNLLEMVIPGHLKSSALLLVMDKQPGHTLPS